MANINKENIKHKLSTKIPLPLKPLPAIPKVLLVSKPGHDGFKRGPLKTLMQTNSMPTTSDEKVINNEPLQVSKRHVTVRQRNENLDWNYKVFRGNCKDRGITTSHDCDSDENSEVKLVNNNKNEDCFGDSRLVSTPTKSLLEPKVARIKRSLKRPHSRELQLGWSSAPKREKVDKRVKRRLFNESLEGRLSSHNYSDKKYTIEIVQDYADDIFENLLNAEKKPLGVPKVSSINRSCIINWLLNVNGPGGNPAIVQSACWYLDSVLGTSFVGLDKMQLVAAACFWIAQKLHGPVVSSMKLVKCSKTFFTSTILMKAEKSILWMLKFPAQPVVAQEFLTYLSMWCDNNSPGEIEAAATFLCLSGLMVEKVLCVEFPSVIAAASVRNALLLLGKIEMITQLEMSPIYKAVLKKTASILCICSIQRRAVRKLSEVGYEYKAPLELYNLPPFCIAQKIMSAANELADLDITQTSS